MSESGPDARDQPGVSPGSRLRNGGISFDDAIAIARTTRSIEMGIYETVGGYDPERGVADSPGERSDRS